MPVKHLDMQAAIYTHLSQSIGAGAFDGQHGMSLAISSAESVARLLAMSFAMACIEAWEGVSAMTGRDTGANARPAITRVANRRRMAKLQFTELTSHKPEAMETHLFGCHGDSI